MNATQLITELQKLVEEFGDLEVRVGESYEVQILGAPCSSTARTLLVYYYDEEGADRKDCTAAGHHFMIEDVREI